MKSYLITCELASPFCGDAPMLDSLVEYQQAAEEGTENSGLITRSMALSEIKRPPSLFKTTKIDGLEIAHVSSPILSDVLFSEYVTHAGQVVSNEFVLGVTQKALKKIPTTKGRYKSYYQKYNVRSVEKISWFAVCEIEAVMKYLSKIQEVGKKRACGYGMVKGWTYTEADRDSSFFAEVEGEKVLMRPLPLSCIDGSVKKESYYRGTVGVAPPYWHPETTRVCAIPA